MENVEKLLTKVVVQQGQMLEILAYQSKLLEDLYEEKDKKTNAAAARKQEMAAHMSRIRGVLTSACGKDKQAVKIFDEILTAGMPKR